VLKPGKQKDSFTKPYHEMTEFEKATYNLIHQMRLEITQEAIQTKLLQYIKENRDEIKLNEFC